MVSIRYMVGRRLGQVWYLSGTYRVGRRLGQVRYLSGTLLVGGWVKCGICHVKGLLVEF